MPRVPGMPSRSTGPKRSSGAKQPSLSVKVKVKGSMPALGGRLKVSGPGIRMNVGRGQSGGRRRK